MSAGFTPGPWSWARNEACLGLLKGAFVRAGGTPVAEVNSKQVGSQETCEANARLIAAAPELLAVLIAACEQSERVVAERGPRTDEAEAMYQRARAAIAKATGSEP